MEEQPAILVQIDPDAPLPPHFTVMSLRDLRLPWYPSPSGLPSYVDDLQVIQAAAACTGSG